MGGDPKLVGTTLAGRYQLVRLLGDGGMGAVYKAADQVLRRFVAIKLLHPAVAQRPASVERFQREARAAAAIGHPNIIDILDFGVDDRPYMVMEYLRGRSLSQVLAAEGALAISRAVSIAAHALAGLAAAHERGILHRDLKPANLMLVQRFGDKSFVKVCDFGFAALMGPTSAEDGKTLTPARTLVGTPAYASPERLRGDDRRDPRVDIYSIGVVLFEMLAGRRPFEGETFRDLARAVKHDPPPRLTSLRPDVPAALDEVVQRALAKAPEARFRNAEEFAAALVPFGGRTIALDDEPSDSFSFEVWQIRQRDVRKKGTRPSIELPKVPDLPPTRPPPANRALGSPADLAPPPPLAPTVRTRPVGREPPGGPSPAASAPQPPPVPPLRPHSVPRPDMTMRVPALDVAMARVAAETALRPGEPRPLEPRAVAKPPPMEVFDDATALDQATLWLQRRHRRAPAAPSSDLPRAVLERAASIVEGSSPRPATVALPERHRRIGESPEEPIEELTQVSLLVRGKVVVGALRFVARRFGERSVKEVIDALEPNHRRSFEEGIEPGHWYPGELFTSLAERIDAVHGRDDLHIIVELGRAVAEGAFDDMRKLKPPAPPIELLLSELPRITRGMIQGAETSLRRIGRGYARIELIERTSPSLTLAVLVLGLVERSLGRFGATDVEVNLLSARALDDAETLYDISWIA